MAIVRTLMFFMIEVPVPKIRHLPMVSFMR
jgi:hypothetical protein